MNNEKKFVCYEDFGALGDGVCDDYAAIKAAHDYANENGLPIVCRENAVYRICDTRIDGELTTIAVKTDVNFSGSTVIFDDENIAADDGTGMHAKDIFTLVQDVESYNLSSEELLAIGKIERGAKKLNVTLPYPAFLIVRNENHKIYIRYGMNANSGSATTDLVLVDENGNVDESTPILFDYDEVTYVRVIKSDTRPIVFENLTVINRVSRVSTRREEGKIVRNYFNRAIMVSRSNVTIKNLTHKIVGEYTVEEQAAGLLCPSYHGVVTVREATNVTIKNAEIPARRYYGVNGTYGFTANLSNQINVINVKQPNFYKEDGKTLSVNGAEYWGWGGVNHTKNLVYDGCEITRYDAHAGLVNGKIINSHVSVINLIGGGDMLIENSLLEYDRIFNLRADYGATWRGTVTVRNCKIKPTSKVYHLCSLLWTNTNFGQSCHYPNVLIDNLSFVGDPVPATVCTNVKSNDPKRGCLLSEKNIHLETLENGEENLNPYYPPKYLKFINNKANIDFYIEDLPFFENTEVEGFKKIKREDSPAL